MVKASCDQPTLLLLFPYSKGFASLPRMCVVYLFVCVECLELVKCDSTFELAQFFFFFWARMGRRIPLFPSCSPRKSAGLPRVMDRFRLLVSSVYVRRGSLFFFFFFFLFCFWLRFFFSLKGEELPCWETRSTRSHVPWLFDRFASKQHLTVLVVCDPDMVTYLKNFKRLGLPQNDRLNWSRF